MVFGQLVILSYKELHLMTSNPEYIPTCDIIQGQDHFLIKIGLWLVVNQIQIQIQMFIGTTMWNMSYQYTQIQQKHTHKNTKRRKILIVQEIQTYAW